MVPHAEGGKLASMLGEEHDEPSQGARASRAAMPNFLIIGAARSGTTSLWHYLRQHPQIYMSHMKHTRFFALESGDAASFRGPGPQDVRIPWSRSDPARWVVTDLESYREFFSGVTTETALGEASHSCLYSPKAPGRIRRYAPDARLIAVLRNPVERAYSHYCYMVQTGRESFTDFARALRDEQARVRDGWWPEFHYTRFGFYHAQLQRYSDWFERDRIRIYLYEDLEARPLDVLRDMFQFLEVDAAYTPDVAVRYNASGRARNRVLHRLLLEMSLVRPLVEPILSEEWRRRVLRGASGLKRRNLHKPGISPEVRRALIETYRDDISDLQQLIQRDLSSWLK